MGLDCFSLSEVIIDECDSGIFVSLVIFPNCQNNVDLF